MDVFWDLQKEQVKQKRIRESFGTDSKDPPLDAQKLRELQEEEKVSGEYSMTWDGLAVGAAPPEQQRRRQRQEHEDHPPIPAVVTVVQAIASPPPMNNLGLWFDYYDVDGNGKLDVGEMVAALVETNGATTPQQVAHTRETVEDFFCVFGTDECGGIDKRGFCSPGGLGETLLDMTKKKQCAQDQHRQRESESESDPNQQSQAQPQSSHQAYKSYQLHQSQEQQQLPETWICSSCSFRSFHGKVSCAMCGVPSSAAAAAAAAAEAEGARSRARGSPQPSYHSYNSQPQEPLSPTSKPPSVRFHPKQQQQQSPLSQLNFHPYQEQQQDQSQEKSPPPRAPVPFNPYADLPEEQEEEVVLEPKTKTTVPTPQPEPKSYYPYSRTQPTVVVSAEPYNPYSDQQTQSAPTVVPPEQQQQSSVPAQEQPDLYSYYSQPQTAPAPHYNFYNEKNQQPQQPSAAPPEQPEPYNHYSQPKATQHYNACDDQQPPKISSSSSAPSEPESCNHYSQPARYNEYDNHQPSQPKEELTAEQFKQKGNAALQGRKFTQAIEYYTSAIRLDTSNHVYYSNRSAAYLLEGNAYDALNDAETCIQRSRGNFAKGYSRKGAALHALQRYDDSMTAYQDGLLEFPNDAGLKKGLESVRSQLRQQQQKNEQSTKAEAIKWKAKGNQALKAGNFSLAIDYYTSAIRLDNSNHVYYSNRSAAYLSEGNAYDALNDAETCIQRSKGNFAKGYSRKGAALHALKRYSDSVAAYRTGIRKFPNETGLKHGLETVQREQGQQQRQQQRPSEPCQQERVYQTMRITIPIGMEPGEKLHVRTGFSDQLTLVTIPNRRNWIMPPSESGQPSFEVRIALNESSNANNNAINSHQHTQYQRHHQQHHHHEQQHPWQCYDYFQRRSIALPRVGDTKTVPILPSLSIVRPSGRFRALLIGINYTGTRAALRGCVNDAQNMKHLLMQNGYPNDSRHMVVLTDDKTSSRNYQPTGSNILKGVQWLIQGASYGDILFFHFSGHGAQVPDHTGQEADGLNETILPLDYKNKQITDDELWGNLVYPLPNGTRLTAIMDCCHSGTGLDLPYEYKSFDGDWHEEINPAHSQGDVILLSGCEDAQTSADTTQYGTSGGAMTQSFIKAFQQLGARSSSSFPQLFDLLHQNLRSRGFHQKPQLTSSQPFNVNRRMFSLTEGIEPNHNRTIGRVFRKKIKAATNYRSGMDLDDFLFGGGAAIAVGAAVLGAIFD